MLGGGIWVGFERGGGLDWRGGQRFVLGDGIGTGSWWNTCMIVWGEFWLDDGIYVFHV